jgi:hypothetical protein
MNDILIFDDIIPVQHQEFLEYYFLRGDNKWYFQKDITYADPSAQEAPVKHYGFSNLIYDRSSKADMGADFYNILPILYQAGAKIGIDIGAILRMRAFLQLPIASNDSTINNAHTDMPINHLVALYYLTDADGDTFIYNETERSETYTVKKQVTPKRGRCVIFDGRLYHSSSRPTNNKRCVLNINFLPK